MVETNVNHDIYDIITSTGAGAFYVDMGDECGPDESRSRLALAAPEMCRALLAVEKSVHVGYGYPDGKKKRDEHRDATYGEHLKCPWCPYVFYEHITLKNFFHHPNCPVDAALTKAGLPDQESRDAARKELGI